MSRKLKRKGQIISIVNLDMCIEVDIFIGKKLVVVVGYGQNLLFIFF